MKPEARKPELGDLMVATQPAFYRGVRMRRGAEFTFQGGDVAKWAAVKGSPEAVLKPEPVAADTKPAATQRAVKAKVAGIHEAT